MNNIMGLGQYLLLVVVSTVLLITSGCTEGPTPVLTLEEIVARAEEASRAVTSFRIVGEISGISDEGPQHSDISAEWAAPGSMHMRFVSFDDGQEHVNELIMLGGQMFSLDLHDGEGEWREQSRRASPAAGPSGLPASVPNAELLADEIIDGIPVFHLRGEQVTEPRPTPEPGSGSVVNFRATMDIYINKANYRAVRLVTVTDMPFVESRLVEGIPVYTTIPQRSTTTYSYYDYNVPIIIEPPDVR